ncbi:MAG TPA: DUF6531 domain-containing protein, partial [Candidatus Binatia bacterium]|nr:DUF6531 domain-containing protein [Candidatus Binatia bacterium]
MVAIVSGLGLGLFNTSANTLGGASQAGPGNPGRNGEAITVNSATGNLVIQQVDERLASVGLDTALIRTYNSRGEVDGDNNDGWRIGVYRRVHSLTGTVNTTGSTVTKTFGDGADIVYTYDAARGLYVSPEGEGAHDTLLFSANQWIWTDGSGRNTETYDWAGGAGKLLSSRDTDGNALTYGYTGSLLTSIIDASGQTTYLDYSGNNLTQIRVVSSGQTQTLTRYYYDASNRLTQVVVDLSPADNSVSLSDGNGDGMYDSIAGQTYVTRYTYEGASRRIASIQQGDGTQVSFTYQLINGLYRVRTFVDAQGRITTFNYPGASVSEYTLNSAALTTPVPAWASAVLLESSSTIAENPQVAFDQNGNGWAVWR